MAGAVGANGNVVLNVARPAVDGVQPARQNALPAANGGERDAQNPVVNREGPPRFVNHRAFAIAATRAIAILAIGKVSTFFSCLLGRESQPSEEPEYRNLMDRIVTDVSSFCTQLVGYSALGGAAVQLVSGLTLTALITAVAAVLLFRAEAQLQTSAALQRRIDELGEQILELYQLNVQLQAGVDRFAQENGVLQGEVGNLREERQELTGQVQVLRENNGQLTNQVQVLRENNAQQQAFIQNSGDAFRQAHAMYQHTVTAASAAEGRLTAANDRLVGIQTEIARSVARLGDVDKVFAERVQQLGQEIQKIPPAVQEGLLGLFPHVVELLKPPANAEEKERQRQMAQAIVRNPQPLLTLAENREPASRGAVTLTLNPKSIPK